MRKTTRSALAAAAFACIGTAAFGAATYRVVELPLAGDAASTHQSHASAINDKGVVTVSSLHYGKDGHRWDRAQVCPPKRASCKVIESLSDTRPRSDGASDVNTAGQVVGYSMVDGWQKPFLRDVDGTVHSLGSYAPNLPAWATGINDASVVVGYGHIDNDRQRGFVWKDGAMTWLPTLGGDAYSQATGVNAKGQVVGLAAVAGSWPAAHAFVYDITTGVMTDMGTNGGEQSVGHAINSSGDIAGASATALSQGHMHAMRTVGGVMQNLGTLPGDEYAAAYSINDAGDVVGGSSPPMALSRGFIYTSTKGMRDLNDLLAQSDRAAYTVGAGQDINNAGDIAAAARRTSDGKLVAVKLVRLR
ncbi:MAG TPA: hypothetical protein VFY73_09920 [Ideonella sp.]|uniref:hypothetical protein n=1 Tax=Ideonella sp. TaxID=1929293 RepID=UPI002E33FF72|nr:hypothetical protein [Ideonella sp.]HEX5684341.1 hypothetical protein [Ideonella sp.]